MGLVYVPEERRLTWLKIDTERLYHKQKRVKWVSVAELRKRE